MICRNCFNDNPEGTESCLHCGRSMTEVPDEAAHETIYCGGCGAENRDDALYCDSCRRLLGEAPEVPNSFRPSAPAGPAEREFPPKQLVDIIGETFYIYRKHFGPFLGIAAMALLPAFVTPAVPLVAQVILQVALFLLIGIGWGASVEAVSQHYLLGSVRLAVCYSRAIERAVSLISAFLLFSIGSWLVPYLVISLNAPVTILWVVLWLPLACYFLVRWFFFVEAVVIEGKLHVPSLGRSHDLVRGDGWKVFGIGVAFALVSVGAGVMFSVPGLVVEPFSSLLGEMLLVGALVAILPIAWIGGTLVYFHLRQAREGFDLTRLASDMGYEARQ